MEIALQKKLMNIETFIDEYSLSRSKFYQEVRSKMLKVTKVGSRTYIARQDADEWLDNLRKNSI